MTGPQHGGRFGPYRITGVLGRGGMGQVLRAHDGEHERDVALKVLHPQWAQEEGYRDRFRLEARIAARLTEPHVIPIHRYGEIDGQLFLDMRLVEGEDLDSLLRRTGPMDPSRAVDLVGQVARALDAAHAGGLVHRDVKPSNVLLVGRGDGRDLATSAAGEDFAYLADFGVARGADDGPGPALTAVGTAVGSTEYMAPDRFGPTPPDARADVYSLACLLFELLTGRRPFPPGDPARVMAAHLHEPPPAPSSLRPGLPAALDEVVLRGLAKDPDRRWQRAGDLADAARAALTGSGVPVPSPDDAVTAVGPLPTDVARSPTRVVPAAAPVPSAPTLVGAPSAGRPGRERLRPGRRQRASAVPEVPVPAPSDGLDGQADDRSARGGERAPRRNRDRQPTGRHRRRDVHEPGRGRARRRARPPLRPRAQLGQRRRRRPRRAPRRVG